jgi:argininosuccinate lyase
MQKQATLWGAAFDSKPSGAVIAFAAGRDTAGISPADSMLISYDLWVNQAHILMLAKAGIVPLSDAKKILDGLITIQKFASKNKFYLSSTYEDVHSAIESTLEKLIGPEAAGKLHTARSRNDQVNTDMRLYMRDQVLQLVSQIIPLVKTLAGESKKHIHTLMPGFTHHQHAMVTTWGHTLAAFAGELTRDATRLVQWIRLYNDNPLGASAGYGTSISIDRSYTAKLLGFDGVELNSMESLMNRWEPEAALAFDISVFMNHLSSLSETIILFSTPEFGMIRVADAYSTGSSIMPQKKNPDTLEVMKGKASYVVGQLTALMELGKGNFIGYNRDSQWTKYILMDVIRESAHAPVVMQGVIETLHVYKKNMEIWCHKNFIGAASVMEQLIDIYGLPMRQAKQVVEKAVKYSRGSDVVTYAALQKACKEDGIRIHFSSKQIKDWQNPKKIISLTTSFGGPGPSHVRESIDALEKQVTVLAKWHQKTCARIESAKELLKKDIAACMEEYEKT